MSEEERSNDSDSEEGLSGTKDLPVKGGSSKGPKHDLKGSGLASKKKLREMRVKSRSRKSGLESRNSECITRRTYYTGQTAGEQRRGLMIKAPRILLLFYQNFHSDNFSPQNIKPKTRMRPKIPPGELLRRSMCRVCIQGFTPQALDYSPFSQHSD